MNEVENPYVPGAGSPPPALTGRAGPLETVRILLGRLRAGKFAKSLIPTGLRGVGKTVLLNKFLEEAEALGFLTTFIEVTEGGRLARDLVGRLRSILFKLDRGKQAAHAAKMALRVLKSFSTTLGADGIKFGLDIDPELGLADSGDLATDLTDLFVAVGEAARQNETAVLLAIDELQNLNEEEFAALIMAMHRVAQRTLPLVVIGTGLPQIPGLAGDAKSYAERLFEFPLIGALAEADAREAIVEPARRLGVEFTSEALDELVDVTKGYPYFIQEWAYRVWNYASSSPITLDVVQSCKPLVVAKLDESFFRVRFNRLTDLERLYLRAMASFGDTSSKSADIAASLGRELSSVGPLRDGLIKKGMIYMPKHGEVAFTVPLFGEFMTRTVPDFEAKPKPKPKRSPRI